MGEPYHAFRAIRADMVIVNNSGADDNGRMLWRAFETAVMPRRCVFCGVMARSPERHICAGCYEDLPRIGSPPVAASSPFEVELAPMSYEFPIDAAIKAFKFRRRLYYGPALADLLCDVCADLPDDIDAVLPVPLHWRRKWRRGFNQALEIARPVAQQIGVPVIHAVRRCRATPSQSGLSAKARTQNLAGAFSIRGTIGYRHVLLIDDVITTGATLRQVARAVKTRSVKKVSALAVARSAGGNSSRQD